PISCTRYRRYPANSGTNSGGATAIVMMKSDEGRDVPNRANSARAIAASTDNTSVTAITRTALRNCANALGCGMAMDGDDNPSRAVDRAESDSPLTSQRLSAGRADGSRCTGPGQSTRALGLTGSRSGGSTVRVDPHY